MKSKHAVGWLSLGQLISWGSIFYTFALIMVPIERELNISRAQSSMAFSLALLVEGLLAYPVGRLIDRGHARAVMSGGSVLAGVCLVLLSQVDGLLSLYAVWAGLGAAMAAVLYAPAFAVVTRQFPNNFRRAIITMTFLGGLASTVFLPLTAGLIAAWGWRWTMVGLAVFHFAICFPLHAYILQGALKPPHDEAQARATTVEKRRGFAPFIGQAPFLLVACFVVLMMAVTAALPAHMVSLLRENGVRDVWVIAIPASIGVIQVWGRLLLYFFEHHFDLDTANRVIPMLIPAGLGFLLLAPWAGAWAVLLFVLLFGLGNGMITIVKGTAVAQYVSREHMASLNGVLGLPIALARASAPLMLGLLWSPDAGYAKGIAVLVVLSVGAVVALVWAQKMAFCHTDV